MENNVLSGIERSLVLQYLIDGNVPVTVTPLDETSEGKSGEIRSLSSVVFPVAIKAEQISVLKEGIILLKNAPRSIDSYQGKLVRVEFYFNSVGLYFISQMKNVSTGPALVIPKEICRIQDVQVEQKYDFSAKLYTVSDSDTYLSCYPANGFQLFSRPAWSTIQLEKQELAKDYLEKFVGQAKKSGKAGNGIQLVNICRYMVEEKVPVVQSVQSRLEPCDILFMNHERFVFAFEKNDSFEAEAGNEYKIVISFVLRSSAPITRDINAVIRVDSIYTSEDGMKIACDATYSSLQEEDLRFLYEKATSLLFV